MNDLIISNYYTKVLSLFKMDDELSTQLYGLLNDAIFSNNENEARRIDQEIINHAQEIILHFKGLAHPKRFENFTEIVFEMYEFRIKSHKAYLNNDYKGGIAFFRRSYRLNMKVVEELKQILLENDAPQEKIEFLDRYLIRKEGLLNKFNFYTQDW